MARTQPPAKMIRILCFGDSLTAGYTCMGTEFHPYRDKLVQMVEMAFPEYNVEAITAGLSGDRVGSRGNFLKRMCGAFTEGEPSYDWTIVLGGTNDLAWGASAEDLFEALKKTWEIPLSHNTKVLALTVPEAGARGTMARRVAAVRNELNDMIKNYKRENFHAFDLHAAIPYFAMTETDREKYWDDNIHFTPTGYDLIGTKVGMALVSLLVKDKLKGETPARQRRWYRDDDAMFEEEGGDPGSINQGYIVVRRKDLES